MKNIIHDKDNLEFIENNMSELSTYIGKKDEYYIGRFKNEKNKFNFAALFLGPLWLGYRKMYLESFILGIIISVLGAVLVVYEYSFDTMVSESTIRSVNIALQAVLAVSGNYLYFMSLKRKITKKEEKYGVSKKGILYGVLLGIIMPMLSSIEVGFLVGYLWF